MRNCNTPDLYKKCDHCEHVARTRRSLQSKIALLEEAMNNPNLSEGAAVKAMLIVEKYTEQLEASNWRLWAKHSDIHSLQPQLQIQNEE